MKKDNNANSIWSVVPRLRRVVTILENKPIPPPLVLIAGESDRAIELAARQGDYLFINANDLEETARLVQRAKQLAQEKYSRQLKVAMSAFSILCQDDCVEQRLSEIYQQADRTTIDYFQQQMDSSVVAHNKLGTQSTIETNLGLSAHLIGQPESIAHRLKAYEAVGIDLVMLKFESMFEDTVHFYRQVISRYFQPTVTQTVLNSLYSLISFVVPLNLKLREFAHKIIPLSKSRCMEISIQRIQNEHQ